LFLNTYGVCIGKTTLIFLGQYAEKVIPRFITLLQRGEPLTIQGDGRQKRSFLYVQDFVDGVICVIEKGEDGGIYNIGSDTEVTILDLVQHIAQAMNVRDFSLRRVADRPWNDVRYWVHSDALRALGWKPNVSFEEGLRRTVEWYMDHKKSQHYFVEPYQIPIQASLEHKDTETSSKPTNEHRPVIVHTQIAVHPEDMVNLEDVTHPEDAIHFEKEESDPTRTSTAIFAKE